MKPELLEYLEAHKGEYVSGESIAGMLGVTRAAVWKYVEALRREGHIINAVTNKGYSLTQSRDILSEGGIREKLAPNSKVTQVFCLDEVDSTNNYAKRLAITQALHGTLIAADKQTAGRGRHGHTFESPAGTGLYMSLILRPGLDVKRFQMITVADAVAVCLAIEELYPASRGKLGIKWVNDVFLGGRKVAGILTEAVSSVENGEIQSVITGIGINVFTHDFSEEVSRTAGAIFAKGEEGVFTRNELCARIADKVMEFAENLSDPEIIAAYRERSVLTGKAVTFMKNEKECRAVVEGIDDFGGLVVANDFGELETLRSGEVFMVRPEEGSRY